MRLLSVALVALALLPSCKRSEPVAAEPPASAVPVAPPTPPTPSPLEVLRAKTSMADALLVVAPMFVDKHNASSLGTFAFAAWSAEHMRWTDVGVSKDETSYAAIQKDIDEERMKRLSVTGMIIEIAVEKTDMGKWYVGLMQNYGGDLFHFHAVRSTKDVVKGVTAKFYGVVTGWFNYDNSGGGVGHAADVVGMFGLPENRALK